MTIFPQNVAVAVTEGQSISESGSHSALAGDSDSAHFPMSVTAISAGGTSKSLTGGPPAATQSF